MPVERNTEIALRERVKELTCLYAISELSQQDSLTLTTILEKVVKLIPPAWQYPENTVAAITFDGAVFGTISGESFSARQTEDIVVENRGRGNIEVVYISPKPVADEGPFLTEERKLLQAIARKVALLIEKKEGAEKVKLLQDQVRHADRLATIGELTAGIAHEINEPISGILGFAQLAIKNKSNPVETQSDLEKIVKTSLHAREIIKKLMYFSHQLPQKLGPVSLNNVIRDSMNFLEPKCSRQNIIVQYKLDENLSLVNADAVQLNQVLMNLVVNAIQVMPNGGQLYIETSNSGSFAEIIIKDTGTGIPSEIQDQIFKPFFTTKEIGKGTGLGLPVVHGIVTAHKGQIEFESKKGEGTTFKIRFPIIDRKAM